MDKHLRLVKSVEELEIVPITKQFLSYKDRLQKDRLRREQENRRVLNSLQIPNRRGKG
jgi:hypothetical protein